MSGAAPAPRQAVIVHGYGATVDSHWFPWLATELRARGTSTEIVELPAPDTPDVDAWDTAVARAVGTPDAGVALIGHSLGCLSLLRHLGGLDPGWTAESLVLVAGFAEPLPGLAELDAFTAGDRLDDASLDRVRVAARRRTVVHSDDDPVVPPDASGRLARTLAASTVVVPGAGHFLDEDGWTRLPEVLDHL